MATVRSSGLEIGVAYGARDLPDAMHRAGRAASALITVLAEHDIAAADSGTVSVTPMEAHDSARTAWWVPSGALVPFVLAVSGVRLTTRR